MVASLATHHLASAQAPRVAGGDEYSMRVVARGLHRPMGLVVRENRTLFFTEVPTPGVSGRNGGRNKVWELDLKTGVKKLVDEGDPEPNDVAVARNGTLYWTCTSAGVIVEATPVQK